MYRPGMPPRPGQTSGPEAAGRWGKVDRGAKEREQKKGDLKERLRFDRPPSQVTPEMRAEAELKAASAFDAFDMGQEAGGELEKSSPEVMAALRDLGIQPDESGYDDLQARWEEIKENSDDLVASLNELLPLVTRIEKRGALTISDGGREQFMVPENDPDYEDLKLIESFARDLQAEELGLDDVDAAEYALLDQLDKAAKAVDTLRDAGLDIPVVDIDPQDRVLIDKLNQMRQKKQQQVG